MKLFRSVENSKQDQIWRTSQMILLFFRFFFHHEIACFHISSFRLPCYFFFLLEKPFSLHILKKVALDTLQNLSAVSRDISPSAHFFIA